MISNNQWTKSHLGRLGKVRPTYNDPWPKPITKMDIPLYQHNDQQYQVANNEVTQKLNRPRKHRGKRLESDTDFLQNQNMISEHYDQTEEEFQFETIDLAKYYGLEHENIDID